MKSWLRIGIVGAGALAVMLGPLMPSLASGQEQRRKVMVTNLVPRNGANDDFGKDLAKALRDLINDLNTHQAVEEKEVRNTAKKYDLDMDELDCIRSLQLSGQLGANIVFCGEYTEDKQARTFSLTGVQFANAGSNAPLEVPDKTWHKDDYEAAAQEILVLFATFIQRLRDAANCRDYYTTSEWESAERNCLSVLAEAPNDTQVRFVLAQVYRQTERYDEAYAEVLKVIELDPLNENALQLGGWLAITLGRMEEGRAHNNSYLQLNPGNAGIRMRLAYEQAQAGDPEGAMILVAEGLEIEPENTELLLQHASFSIAAGQSIQVEGQPLSVEAGGFYQKGSESYRKAYDVLGPDMETVRLQQMIQALYVLDQLDRAVEVAKQALETHGDEPGLWFIKGRILNRLERVDEALLALDEAEARDPGYPNLKTTQGRWMLDVGREEDALPVLMEAVEKGEQPADVIANLYFAKAVNGGIQPKDAPPDYDYALSMIGMAKTFEPELSSRVLGRLDFYQAFSIYKVAEAEQAPQNLESAKLTLQKFKEVQRLLALGHVVDYIAGSQAQTQRSYQSMRDGVVQFISIQETVIQRGR